MSPSDETLVSRCRQGDREAFAIIVHRYQNLVCSIAFSSTSSLSQSEELAQEAFLAAWRSIDKLRDPQQLRPWLCGIVRNLGRNSARRRERDVLSRAEAIDPQHKAAGNHTDPSEAAIVSEEAALLNRTLEKMPEAYREPLVLYYREQKSVARVAEQLGLTEDVVKQRLFRGRKRLRAEVAAVVERGLRVSAPGRAFTIGVIAALPAMSGAAKAATITVTGAKGVTAMNAASWTGILGAIMGPIAGLAGAWFGVKMSLKSAQSDRERRFIIRSSYWMMAFVITFTGLLTLLLLQGRQLVADHPTTFAVAVMVLIVGYTLGLLIAVIYFNRRLSQIRRDVGAPTMSPDELAAVVPAPLRRWQYPVHYESPVRLLGIPLVAVRFHGTENRRRPAVGWFAFGDIAIGIVFATGPVAMGGISVGAIGVGGVSFAGLAIGAIAVGGAAVGWLATGGAALGMSAFGGCALAWQAAKGGIAVAGQHALGGLALAEHANDDLAREYFANQTFFQVSDLLATHSWVWLVLVAASMLPMLWSRHIADRAAASAKDDPASQVRQ